jgi:O-antigen/teichoic acid export membrane protein
MLKGWWRDGAVVGILGQGGAALAGMFSFMLLARGLEAGALGAWVLFLTGANLLDTLRMGVVRQALVRRLAQAEESLEGERYWLGAAWGLALLVTGPLVAACGLTAGLHAATGFLPKGWTLLLQMSPWLLVAGLGHSVEAWRRHGQGHFWGVHRYRLGISVLFLGGLWLMEPGPAEAERAAWLLVGLHGLASLWAWGSAPTAHRQALERMPWRGIAALWDFGRHSLLTLVGANLLRSADQLLIGWFLGPAAVGVYSVPLKLVQVVETPVRAFSMRAYPRLSRAVTRRERDALDRHGWRWVRALSLGMLPCIGCGFLFPEAILRAISGEAAPEAVPILAIFLIYSLLLPMDRFFGIALDSLDLPKANAGKVWRMLGLNLLGDVLLLAWGAPLWSVALVTLANTLLGLVWAHRRLRRHPAFRAPACEDQRRSPRLQGA